MSTPQRTENKSQDADRAAAGKLPAAIGLALLVCLPAAFVVGILHTNKPHLLAPGDQAPALTVIDLDSSTIHQIGFKGKPAALLFFSADCPHCLREISNFDRLNRRFGDTIRFLAISTSSKSKTSELLGVNQLDIQTVLDYNQAGCTDFGVDIVPALFLVGADGTIIYGESGEKSLGSREQLLLKLSNTTTQTKD
ncbi:MAG: TlpA disulfide reductase family protein [Ignavibacteriales bacterium]|nr:TlpA disulfide reductase family protein [Ignavibacteriales bacterium]